MEKKTLAMKRRCKIALLILAAALLLRCLNRALLGWFTVMALPLLLLCYGAAAVILVRYLIEWRKSKQWTFLLISIAALAILALPWSSWYEEGRFLLLRPRLEAAAQRIMAQQEEGSDTYGSVSVPLPIWDFLLSRGGRAVYYHQDQAVLFYTNRGILDNYAGYLYFPHRESPPVPTDTTKLLYDYYDGLIRYQDKGPHWVYASYS